MSILNKKNKTIVLTLLLISSLAIILSLILNLSNKSKAEAVVFIKNDKLNEILKIKKVKVSVNKSESANTNLNTSDSNKSYKKDLLSLTINPPQGYKRIKTFNLLPEERPEGTSCVTFGDNFKLLVSEDTKGYKQVDKIDGYDVVKVFGENKNYYHILNTDLVKVEDIANKEEHNKVVIDIYKDFKLYNKGNFLSIFSGLAEIAEFIPQPYEALQEENTDMYYSYFLIGNSTDNVITIGSKKEKNYETLYIDQNNNQKLSDEKPIKIYNNQLICDIKLPLNIVGERNIKGQYNICLQKQNDKLSYFPSSYYYKELNINENSYKALVIEHADYDNNMDGIYQNSGVWIDINLDNRFTDDEHFSNGDILLIDSDKSYEVVMM